MQEWLLGLSSADEAPRNAPIILRGTICENLRRAAELGYDAIEVHLRETQELNFAELERVQTECGTKVSMLITGRLFTQGGYSLLNPDPENARYAKSAMKRYMDMAQRLGAGVVLGWAKGNLSPDVDRNREMKRLADILSELCEYGKTRGVAFNIEAINRYECNYFCTGIEIADFIRKYRIENCFVHLDTFHMNIEEADMLETIRRCEGVLGYFHLADNDRRYVGHGSLNFKEILRTLRETGYKGYLTLECLPEPDGETAARRTLQTLRPMFT